jgi:hypothetical protein
MRVRIVRQPEGPVVLNAYRLGHIYDVTLSLAEYLVAKGFAIVEMRDEVQPQKRDGRERRRKKT